MPLGEGCQGRDGRALGSTRATISRRKAYQSQDHRRIRAEGLFGREFLRIELRPQPRLGIAER
jgi:hypothetical protein